MTATLWLLLFALLRPDSVIKVFLNVALGMRVVSQRPLPKGTYIPRLEAWHDDLQSLARKKSIGQRSDWRRYASGAHPNNCFLEFEMTSVFVHPFLIYGQIV